MKGVRVEPKSRTVRVGAGCTTGDVDHATAVFGQAVPFGIISTTGVAGLTLNGGHGYLSRQYGLACDSLIEADVVLADGSFVTASEAENAGPALGAAWRRWEFWYRDEFLVSHASGENAAMEGPIIFDLSDAAAVMRWYRDFSRSAPEEFGSFLGLQTVRPVISFHGEHWGKKMCVLLLAHTEKTRRHTAAIGSVRSALPTPLIDWVGPLSYLTLHRHVRRAQYRRGCNGTGRAISLTRCRMRRSTATSHMRRSCRARFL